MQSFYHSTFYSYALGERSKVLLYHENDYTENLSNVKILFPTSHKAPNFFVFPLANFILADSHRKYRTFATNTMASL